MKVTRLFGLLIVLMSSAESSEAFAPERNQNLRTEASAKRCAMTVGFLGCGTIASAIATGLAKQEKVDVTHVAVTRRSEKRSEVLQKSFPNLVSVHDDNQEVVDQSDVVFVTVLPKQATELLQSLTFDPKRHYIISLVSTATMEDLLRDSKLPNDRVFKMICLPAVAKCNGVCLLLTPQGKDPPVVLDLCQCLGGCVQAETNEEMAALMVTSGMMGTFYGVLRNNSNFLQAHGIPKDDANFLVGNLYQNMIEDATTRQKVDWDEMIDEQTAGGLNEQGLKNANELGIFDGYDKVQHAMLSRLLGKSDGSL
jgi:pyrroline-5-carboxylate reductase